MAFIQGYLASLTLDGNDITLVTADVSMSESKTVLNKSVMDGSGEASSIPGMFSGSLSINGHIDQENLNLLEESWAKQVPVTFTLTIDQWLTTDGSWTGTITLSTFTKATAADSNWSFTLSGETIGVTFTPSEA